MAHSVFPSQQLLISRQITDQLQLYDFAVHVIQKKRKFQTSFFGSNMSVWKREKNVYRIIVNSPT